MPTIFVNGINLYYEIYGLGPSVVLCHGFTGSHQNWLYQLPVLVPQYQVVTMDHRGHGDSDAPSSPDAYSVPIYAKDVRELLNHLNISQCCLVGHSMGGFAALQFAVDYPQLLTALVLVDTMPGPMETPDYAEMRAQFLEVARSQGMAALFEYSATHSPMAQKRFQNNPRLREISKRQMMQMSVDGFVLGSQSMAKREDLTPRLGEIKVPTIVIVGEEDVGLLEPSAKMASGIPGAELHIIPRAAHSPTEEQPEVFNQILLDFLAGL